MKMKVLKIKFVILLSFLLTSWSSSVDAAKYEYDALNRLVRATYDDDMTIVYSYDASGNRTRRLVTVLTDCDSDGDVDLVDFATFVSHWLDIDCVYPDHCEGTDFNWSTQVDLEDFAIFAKHYLYGTGP